MKFKVEKGDVVSLSAEVLHISGCKKFVTLKLLPDGSSVITQKTELQLRKEVEDERQEKLW